MLIIKIVHIALCGPVTDSWTYQDNLLPKYHKLNGHDVVMITSKYIYDSTGEIIIDKRNIYINENDIKTVRLKTYNNKSINYKFKRYKGLIRAIMEESPDILFIHGVQFLDIINISRFLKHNKDIKVYVDNHADFSNSATNWLSKNVLHKLIWKYCATRIEPYTIKFYGVLPARVDFLKDIYKIPKEKVDLLFMGADDQKVIESVEKSSIQNIRLKHDIKPTDFLLITGGKIDIAKKQTLLLMETVKKLNQKNIRLIVFGSVVDELKDEVDRLSDGNKIQYIGWINAAESYNYFGAADLVVFPGRHSVFWEQVVGLGIPMIVKHWNGTTHIDCGGNVKFIKEDTIEEMSRIINEIIDNEKIYNKMKDISTNDECKKFLYSKIAKKSIQ